MTLTAPDHYFIDSLVAYALYLKYRTTPKVLKSMVDMLKLWSSRTSGPLAVKHTLDGFIDQLEHPQLSRDFCLDDLPLSKEERSIVDQFVAKLFSNTGGAVYSPDIEIGERGVRTL